MALASIHVYRTAPGKLAEHQAAASEAKQRLQAMGLLAFGLQPIAGSDVGTIATVVQHADYRAYTDALQQIGTDEGWQKFYAKVAAKGIAEPVEVSLFSDLDPTYTLDPNRPLGVLQTTQWRPFNGKAGAFLDNVATATGHITRLGGTTRVLQSMTGKFPMTTAVSVTFEDLDHFGDYNDKLGADEQFANFWAGIMAAPTAEMVRSGIYLIET